ncbi:hypothetical protein F5888DRAFT_1744617 [Russula emetica]|nr:hypothetical protein F5888DRAFT_1744617 [Russula emetica]
MTHRSRATTGQIPQPLALACLACPRNPPTMFPRFLRPIHRYSRRSYSLFSKPPGGRFFNSSKPPKVVPPASASAKSATRVEASTANGDTQQQQTSSPLPDDASGTTTTSPSSAGSSSPALPTSAAPTALASHPPLSAPDLRLHQFFSQYRPLVLSQPASALFDSSTTLTLNPAPPQGPSSTITASASAAAQATLEDPPETTPEADADTARLLSRTLVMNAVSSAVSWDATLRRLGLNPAENTAALGDQGLAVELDSTRRKRRRKMKKHKLKKRRRLQRAQRLKIGR